MKTLAASTTVALVLLSTLVGRAEDQQQARQAPAAPAPVAATTVAATVDSLAWMAGHWRFENEGRITEEVWLAPAAGLMVGVNRDLRPGSAPFFEYLRIEEKEGAVTYWASPKGAPATPFRLVEQGPHKAVFENPEHDFPQRILYWLDADGHLHARAEAEIDGKTRGSEWVWKKVP